MGFDRTAAQIHRDFTQFMKACEKEWKKMGGDRDPSLISIHTLSFVEEKNCVHSLTQMLIKLLEFLLFAHEMSISINNVYILRVFLRILEALKLAYSNKDFNV